MADTPTPITKQVCQATRGDGQPCKAFARRGSVYCFLHDPNQRDAARAARAAGGKARNTPAPAPPIDLSTPESCIAALQETVDRVRRGDEPLGIGRFVVYATATARAVVMADFDERLKRLEAVSRERS